MQFFINYLYEIHDMEPTNIVSIEDVLLLIIPCRCNAIYQDLDFNISLALAVIYDHQISPHFLISIVAFIVILSFVSF